MRTRPEVALYVLNQKRRHLAELEARFGRSIAISGEPPENGAGFTVERGAPVEDRPERPPAVAMVECRRSRADRAGAGRGEMTSAKRKLSSGKARAAPKDVTNAAGAAGGGVGMATIATTVIATTGRNAITITRKRVRETTNLRPTSLSALPMRRPSRAAMTARRTATAKAATPAGADADAAADAAAVAGAKTESSARAVAGFVGVGFVVGGIALRDNEGGQASDDFHSADATLSEAYWRCTRGRDRGADGSCSARPASEDYAAEERGREADAIPEPTYHPEPTPEPAPLRQAEPAPVPRLLPSRSTTTGPSEAVGGVEVLVPLRTPR